MKSQNQTSNLFQFKINQSLFICDWSYSSFVCISAYANVCFKTTFIKPNMTIILLQNNIHMSEVHCGSAVQFGQALPGFLITTHHLYASIKQSNTHPVLFSVCVYLRLRISSHPKSIAGVSSASVRRFWATL